MSYPIPSAYTRLIARVLRLPERRLAALLRGTGLPGTIFDPADETLLTAPQQLRVMKNARALSPDADLGLQIGQALDPASHGALGYLVLSSPDLSSALQELHDFLPIRLPWTSISLSQDETWIDVQLDVNMDMRGETEVAQMINECFAVIMQSFCEQLLGRVLAEARIGFTHPRPSHAASYGHFLHAPCAFSQLRTSYRLPRGLGYEANLVADPATYRVARELCADLLSRQHRDMAGRSMATKVRTLLLLKPLATTSEKTVADALFVSPRTLARRLDAEGTSYRAVRDEVLLELSVRCLRESTQSIESIASTLGYGDSAAFRKAFRRWTGEAPSRFRAGHGAP